LYQKITTGYVLNFSCSNADSACASANLSAYRPYGGVRRIGFFVTFLLLVKIEYRSQTESLITEVSRKPLNKPYGIFESILYTDKNTQQAHLAIVNGQPTPDTETYVRVHERLYLAMIYLV
jgi:GTP cyclohydrolase II